ncbi:CocE/NonD family hydrolase [Streptomyces purpureus]|uniref:Xaa-Pro dipeptidyl-peptidase C-terminal domain-containing protein n=1 Tax=Streptomyces purpureus TaxID=1951 RepID=A0A918LQU7_9ACTN|nr:CocE/NonD family hydrolase [Streptomyces purpureus]GGT35962.1 hypothetical protein GCM10014713_31940 [Streptomyces purpureus]
MTSPVQGSQPESLYPELDEAALAQYFAALTGDETAPLAPARAAEVAEARALVAPVPVRIPGAGQDLLDGVLWTHLTGDRARPAIVMPSPWTDLGWLAYAVQATRFAYSGYNVLAYTARGFGRSEGEVEVGGPLDIEDGSRALDFLIERTGGEPTRVGFLGDSYGSGISQLVAAHDHRVDAVVALSTWGDLGEAFYENTTRHTEAVRKLLAAAQNARLSKRTQQVFDDVLADRNVDETLQWAAERSPYTYVAALNSRQVPVFFAHAWHETLFPSNQTLRMFHALTGPKRINMSIGDHSGPEMTGIVGLPNRIWTDAHRWLGHHLQDDDNGIDTEGQVVSQIMWNKALESRPTWAAVTGSTQRLYLASPGATGDHTLADGPDTGWSLSIQTGADTPATVADEIILTGYDEMAGNPKVYPTAAISRADAGVWVTAPLPVTTGLRGVPRLRLTYTPSADRSTFVAHLFDVAPSGSAHIVTHAPFTRLDGEPGVAVTADIELQATGYDVPAGHRLMLVIDTRDPFYGDANAPRATLTLSSPAADPSHLELPLR